MVNYSNGIIYIVRNFKNNDIFISNTTSTLSKRFSAHKTKSSNDYIQNYIITKYNGDWNDWYIELYENHPCNNRMELEKRTNEIIRDFKNNPEYFVINR